ncbi:MAG: hypothetical protein M0024_10800 [Nitrospiraceae bacterium]|nr:hypothetical protein [Nitrospiraceae bacterium]
MTQSRFFQVSLFFPFIVWFLALTLFSFANHESNNFLLKNLSDAYRVFVPYLVFAAGVWHLSKNRPYRTLMAMASVIPIIWGCFFSFFYMLYIYGKEGFIDWFVVSVMAFWAALVAYLFEFIPFLVLVIFKNNLEPEGMRNHKTSPLGHSPAAPQA